MGSIYENRPYKLVSKGYKKNTTVIKLQNINIGGDGLVIMAGPCAVESRKQTLKTAKYIKKAGAHILRGGAYKPRTSPYSFQGLGIKGLRILKEAKKITGLPVITEVVRADMVELVSRYADILQIGSRNMQNYQLLKEVGRSKKIVMLKRGMASTVKEWLNAAEYILKEGNFNVILCERGIKTFENTTRNTLDLSAVALVKQLSHLPVIVDPSHATGNWKLVTPMAKAAVAAGADGIIVEVHPDPDMALSDGYQSLTFSNFSKLVEEIKIIAKASGKKFP